jgi:hypothetical protein
MLPLDKSFAHAVSATNLTALSRKCDFLVPSAFYYEIFDTKPAKRRQTLAGLESFRRIDISSLLRQETKTGQPIGEVKAPVWHFNRKVLDPDWVLSEEEAAVQKQYEDHVVIPALAFWGDVIKERQVVGFTTEELKTISAPPREFTALCQLLCGPEKIRSIAALLSWPHAALLDEGWFHFRHYQALVLQGLILLRRHQRSGDIVSQRRLEHDVHDVEYLTLGLITGHLATNEVSNDFNNFSLQWRFRLFRPTGMLVTPATLPNFL